MLPRIRLALPLLLTLAIPGTGFAQATPELAGVWGRIVSAESRQYYLHAFQPTEPQMTPWGEAKFKETRPSFGERGVPVEQTNDPVYNGLSSSRCATGLLASLSDSDRERSGP